MPINRGHVPLGKRIPLENIGCQRSAATVVPPVFRESRPVASHIWRAPQFANRETGKHMTSASRKTPRCIHYDCHAPGHRNYGPIPGFSDWVSDEIETMRQLFLRFRRPPRLLCLRSTAILVSPLPQILHRYHEDSLQDFFLFSFSRISTLTLFFSAPLPGRFFNLPRKRLERSFLSLKFYFSSEKGLPSQFFFLFLFFEDLSPRE